MRADKFFNEYCYNDLQSILELCDELAHNYKENYSSSELKKQAATYLGVNFKKHKLSKGELRHLFAKARKIKNSIKKEGRAHCANLEKQLIWTFNCKDEK